MLKTLFPPRSALARFAQGSQLLTRAPVDLALALFGLSLLCDGASHYQRNAKAFSPDAATPITLTLDGSYLCVLARTI